MTGPTCTSTTSTSLHPNVFFYLLEKGIFTPFFYKVYCHICISGLFCYCLKNLLLRHFFPKVIIFYFFIVRLLLSEKEQFLSEGKNFIFYRKHVCSLPLFEEEKKFTKIYDKLLFYYVIDMFCYTFSANIYNLFSFYDLG